MQWSRPLSWTDDNATAAAVEAWTACVNSISGQQAATPNEFARRYAVLDRQTTAEPNEIAIGDAMCQAQTHLHEVLATSIARHERALMGANVAGGASG